MEFKKQGTSPATGFMWAKHVGKNTKDKSKQTAHNLPMHNTNQQYEYGPVHDTMELVQLAHKGLCMNCREFLYSALPTSGYFNQ
jgi:hypothetical protein